MTSTPDDKRVAKALDLARSEFERSGGLQLRGDAEAYVRRRLMGALAQAEADGRKDQFDAAAAEMVAKVVEQLKPQKGGTFWDRRGRGLPGRQQNYRHIDGPPRGMPDEERVMTAFGVICPLWPFC
ncbi:MAG: hypothetical protein JWN61_3234 [Pseudonocardiales bacterium]|nr:hypothetical protein [Pseudonocardiales bacterium]